MQRTNRFNPFTRRIAPQDNWLLPVCLLCIPLGWMLASTWVTESNRPSRMSLLSPDQQQRVEAGTVDQQQEIQSLSQEVAKLGADKTKLENSLANQTGSTKILNQSLQDAKMFAGLTDLQGPGVVVTLRDSQKPPQAFIQDQIIHDGDVLRVVNELWNAGAEAISVNGNRVVATTSIRCVGSTILVNNIQVASPIAIRAIGDSKTLLGALNLPGGVLSDLRNTDPAMVDIQPVDSMRLAAFTGTTTHRIATLAPPVQPDSSQVVPPSSSVGDESKNSTVN